MLPYQQRVVDEKNELDTKLAALNAFFHNPVFTAIDPAEQGRMRRQSAVMQTYAAILAERIAAFLPEEYT